MKLTRRWEPLKWCAECRGEFHEDAYKGRCPHCLALYHTPSHDTTRKHAQRLGYGPHRPLSRREGGVITEAIRAQRRPLRRKAARAKMEQLVARDGAWCQACGSERLLTVDHVQPLSRGGTNELVNLQLLCHRCNHLKADRLPGPDGWPSGIDRPRISRKELAALGLSRDDIQGRLDSRVTNDGNTT